MGTTPTLRIHTLDYYALPVHTNENLPPTNTLPDGFRCRTAGGYIHELVNFENLNANQHGLLSAPKRGFNSYKPDIFGSLDEKTAVARVEKARAELREAEEDLKRFKPESAT